MEMDTLERGLVSETNGEIDPFFGLPHHSFIESSINFNKVGLHPGVAVLVHGHSDHFFLAALAWFFFHPPPPFRQQSPIEPTAQSAGIEGWKPSLQMRDHRAPTPWNIPPRPLSATPPGLDRSSRADSRSSPRWTATPDRPAIPSESGAAGREQPPCARAWPRTGWHSESPPHPL